MRWLACSSLCGLVLLAAARPPFLPAKRYDLLAGPSGAALRLVADPGVSACRERGTAAEGGARIAAIAGRLLLLEVPALVTCIVFLAAGLAEHAVSAAVAVYAVITVPVPFFIAFVTAYGQDRRTFAKRQEQEKGRWSTG
ncbi:MAG: hypothetical protein ACLVJ6_14385 [Merdibacter sp.]